MTTAQSGYDPLIEYGSAIPLTLNTTQETRDTMRALLHDDVKRFWERVLSDSPQEKTRRLEYWILETPTCLRWTNQCPQSYTVGGKE